MVGRGELRLDQRRLRERCGYERVGHGLGRIDDRKWKGFRCMAIRLNGEWEFRASENDRPGSHLREMYNRPANMFSRLRADGT